MWMSLEAVTAAGMAVATEVVMVVVTAVAMVAEMVAVRRLSAHRRQDAVNNP